MLKFLAALLVFTLQYNHPLYEVAGMRIGASTLALQSILKTAIVPEDEKLLTLFGIILGQEDHLPLYLADGEYLAPEPREIIRILKVAKNKDVYEPEVYDCDDYSWWYKGQLAREWRKAGNKTPLAICQVYAKIEIVRTKEIAHHAFNGIMDSTGHMIWIEPQSNSVINESKVKILEIYLLSF